MVFITRLIFFTILLTSATHASEGKRYIGIFDATVAATGHLNLMMRQIEISTSGEIRKIQKIEPIAIRLEGLNAPIEFFSNQPINLSDELKKTNQNGHLKLICPSCSSNIPIEIKTQYEMHSEFTLTQSIVDIKIQIAEFKKDIEDRAIAHDRAIQRAKADAAAAKKEEEKRRIAFLERHHRRCLSFGFKANTEGYAQCRLKLELAEQQTERDLAISEAEDRRTRANSKERAEQLKRDQDERRRYHEAQLAEQKRQRDTAAGLALMQMGSNIASGGYTQPPAPARPMPPSNQTIVTPSGRIVNCNTVGTITNCF